MIRKSKTIQESLKIVYVSTNQLKESPNNARTHSEKQVAKIARSIKKLGFNNPVLVDQNNSIIAGHGRVRAAKLLGLTDIPTICLDHLSSEEIRAYIIADNKLAEEAGWDNEILKIELQGLMEIYPDFDIELTGFDIPDIDVIVNSELTNNKKQDKADILPDENKVPQKVKSGDLWKLGNHCLYCGDARDESSFRYLLDKNKAAFVFTDPPYNVKIDGHVCGSGKIKHDEFVMAKGEMTSDEFTGFLTTTLGNLVKYSVDGSLHCICMDWRHILEIMSAGNNVYTKMKYPDAEHTGYLQVPK